MRPAGRALPSEGQHSGPRVIPQTLTRGLALLALWGRVRLAFPSVSPSPDSFDLAFPPPHPLHCLTTLRSYTDHSPALLAPHTPFTSHSFHLTLLSPTLLNGPMLYLSPWILSALLFSAGPTLGSVSSQVTLSPGSLVSPLSLVLS
jgi:hypothetical protein